MTASVVEISNLGKNGFYSALNMPYPNGKIIASREYRPLIGYSGRRITLQLP